MTEWKDLNFFKIVLCNEIRAYLVVTLLKIVFWIAPDNDFGMRLQLLQWHLDENRIAQEKKGNNNDQED